MEMFHNLGKTWPTHFSLSPLAIGDLLLFLLHLNTLVWSTD